MSKMHYFSNKFF